MACQVSVWHPYRCLLVLMSTSVNNAKWFNIMNETTCIQINETISMIPTMIDDLYTYLHPLNKHSTKVDIKREAVTVQTANKHQLLIQQKFCHSKSCNSYRRANAMPRNILLFWLKIAYFELSIKQYDLSSDKWKILKRILLGVSSNHELHTITTKAMHTTATLETRHFCWLPHLFCC